MDIFLLYLFTRVDPLMVFLACSAFALAMAALFIYINSDMGSWRDNHREKEIAEKKLAMQFLKAAIPFVVALVVIPSQKDLALILAGYGVIEVAKSETAGRLASKSVRLIEQTLDGYLKKAEDKK